MIPSATIVCILFCGLYIISLGIRILVTLMVYFLGGLLIYGDHFLSHNQSAVRVESERS
jgi:hypothetical protein